MMPVLIQLAVNFWKSLYLKINCIYVQVKPTIILLLHCKRKFSITDFFSKCDQIRRKLRICSHLLKKSVMENFIFFCEVLLYLTNTRLHSSSLQIVWYSNQYFYLMSPSDILRLWIDKKEDGREIEEILTDEIKIRWKSSNLSVMKF